MALSQSSVMKLYKTVIEDVISGVRESFLDEGVDEQVLMELKQIWETKLDASKAVETNPEPIEPQPPLLPSQKSSLSKNSGHYSQGSSSAGSSKSQAQQQQQQQQHQQQKQQQQQQQQQQQLQQLQQQQKQQQQQQQQVVNQQIQPQPQPAPVRPPVLQPAQQPIQQHVQPIQPAPVQNRVNLIERQVPIQITLPGNPATDGKPKVLTIQVPASAIQGNQLPTILTGQVITEAMGYPPDIASRMLQQHVDRMLQGQAAIAPIAINQPLQVIRQDQSNIAQMDGQLGETSDDDDDDDEDDNEDDDELDDDKEEEENDDAGAREEEPLNSEDDVTDDDPGDLFDTENVVVCQYDKITRSRNKWKFYLKDGIMNLEGRDYVFQKANGDAEW